MAAKPSWFSSSGSALSPFMTFHFRVYLKHSTLARPIPEAPTVIFQWRKLFDLSTRQTPTAFHVFTVRTTGSKAFYEEKGPHRWTLAPRLYDQLVDARDQEGALRLGTHRFWMDTLRQIFPNSPTRDISRISNWQWVLSSLNNQRTGLPAGLFAVADPVDPGYHQFRNRLRLTLGM